MLAGRTSRPGKNWKLPPWSRVASSMNVSIPELTHGRQRRVANSGK